MVKKPLLATFTSPADFYQFVPRGALLAFDVGSHYTGVAICDVTQANVATAGILPASAEFWRIQHTDSSIPAKHPSIWLRQLIQSYQVQGCLISVPVFKDKDLKSLETFDRHFHQGLAERRRSTVWAKRVANSMQSNPSNSTPWYTLWWDEQGSTNRAIETVLEQSNQAGARALRQYYTKRSQGEHVERNAGLNRRIDAVDMQVAVTMLQDYLDTVKSLRE